VVASLHAEGILYVVPPPDLHESLKCGAYGNHVLVNDCNAAKTNFSSPEAQDFISTGIPLRCKSQSGTRSESF
jgi:hypothetical protein